MAESTIREELHEATTRLRRAGVESAQLDAEALLEFALGVDRTCLIAHGPQTLRDEEVFRYHAYLARRETREPVPYITGRREFWSLEFIVTPAVLIPRPETETLVEEAVSRLRGRPVAVADIGVGSGAIAVALAKELPEATVFGTDSSPCAMEVAGANVVKHQVEQRITLLAGELLEPLETVSSGLFDAVVSNPPYIPSGLLDSLEPEVARFEPRLALDGGPDGLEFHRRILADARRFLKPGGLVLLEIGWDQGSAVLEMARRFGYDGLSIGKDLARLDRVFIGSWVSANGDT